MGKISPNIDKSIQNLKFFSSGPGLFHAFLDEFLDRECWASYNIVVAIIDDNICPSSGR